MEIPLILFGLLCGNLAAIVVPPSNLGLFWNTVLGVAGGAAVAYAPLVLGQDYLDPWYFDLAAAGAAGAGLTLIFGGLVALRYRN